MRKCLCCGKEIRDSSNETEKNTGWHARCIKSFFGTKDLPDIDVDDEKLKLIAVQSTEKGFTVPGVQKKLSLHLTEERSQEKPRLTLVNYPTGYILKPQTEEYAYLPESEYLVMSMANKIGIKTVPFALIRQGEGFAYITKRIDRIFDKKKNEVKMLAMEDFCQLDRRLTQDKYKGSYERCGKIVQRYSARPKLDMTELYLRVVFSFLVGNSDMHLKNFSLIETEENSKMYVLSDAYDMLPVNIILPTDLEQFALTINGKKRNVTRNDFLSFAKSCSIDKKVAEKMLEKVLSQTDILLLLCEESYLPDEKKKQLTELISLRASRIRKKL